MGGLACALLLGGMVIFAGFFAPLAFSKLPEDTAAGFVRAIFPPYYSLMTLLAGVSAASLSLERRGEAIALALVAAGFLLARYWLMPATQRLHAAREAGEYGAAERFAKAHRQSALLNMLQIIVVLVVMARLLVAG